MAFYLTKDHQLCDPCGYHYFLMYFLVNLCGVNKWWFCKNLSRDPKVLRKVKQGSLSLVFSRRRDECSFKLNSVRSYQDNSTTESFILVSDLDTLNPISFRETVVWGEKCTVSVVLVLTLKPLPKHNNSRRFLERIDCLEARKEKQISLAPYGFKFLSCNSWAELYCVFYTGFAFWRKITLRYWLINI